MCDKFTVYVFFSLHIPLITTLWIWKYYDLADIPTLFLIHAICFAFILLLKSIADRRVALFTNAFYTDWYDKILNFDLITIKELRPVVLNALKSEDSKNLLSAIREFSKSDKERCDMLSQNTMLMTAELDEFIKLQNGTEVVTWQNIIDSFDDNLKKVNELSDTLGVICDNINNAFPNFAKLSDKTKVDINAINKNSALLLELKQLLSFYKSEALSVELIHLERVTASLENNIGNTFTSIDTTIRKNADDLRSSYDSFFAICEKFNEAVSTNFEAGTIDALVSLNGNFSKGLENIEKTHTELEKAVTETSDSIRKLCDSVYNFTQFTLSPHFMDKIRGYFNFTQKLNDAHAKLVSYDKLIELYKSKDVSVQEMVTQIQKLQNDAANVKKLPAQIPILQKNITDVQSSIESIEYRIKNIDERLNNDIQKLSKQFQEDERKIGSRLKTVENNSPKNKNVQNKVEDIHLNKSPQNITNDPIVAEFNEWAANPSTKLPVSFYYLVGDFGIGTIQRLIETFSETKWITNRNGSKKYIFPNPNFLRLDWIGINQQADISQIYKMNEAMLKSKGQNKIKIITACKMSSKGYINYPGELELL